MYIWSNKILPSRCYYILLSDDAHTVLILVAVSLMGHKSSIVMLG